MRVYVKLKSNLWKIKLLLLLWLLLVTVTQCLMTLLSEYLLFISYWHAISNGQMTYVTKNMVRSNIIFCLTNIYLWYTWAIKCVTNNYYTRTLRLITVSHSHFKHGQIEVKKIWNNGNLFRLLIRIFNVTGLTLQKKTVWRMSSTK